MPRSREQIMLEWDAIRAKIADGCTNSGPRDWFEGVMDEQDHIIADLVRETVRLKYFESCFRAHQSWNDQAKEDAGFHRNTPFDDVWAVCLKAYRDTLPKPGQ